MFYNKATHPNICDGWHFTCGKHLHDSTISERRFVPISLFFLSASTKPGKLAVMYMCVKDSNFSSVYRYMIFLLDLGLFWQCGIFYYTPAPRRGVYCFTSVRLFIRPSFRPSKIFFVAFFSVTVDGRNLIFGHKHDIGIPYCG